MIEIFVKGIRLWDEQKEEFIISKDTKLQLEHSLLSLSKWEAKHHKAYLSKKVKITNEEQIDYLRCMTINKNVDPNIYYCMTSDQIKQIGAYINDTNTATVIRQSNKTPNNEIITSELIYYWMISYNIPFECEKWHLNRLITLIQICSIKNQPPKKRSKNAIVNDYAKLNAERRARMRTAG